MAQAARKAIPNQTSHRAGPMLVLAIARTGTMIMTA
jgi:hypothetical protein